LGSLVVVDNPLSMINPDNFGGCIVALVCMGAAIIGIIATVANFLQEQAEEHDGD
jgi:hypothetical protein